MSAAARIGLALSLLLLPGPREGAGQEAAYDTAVRPFLERHCSDCHGGDKPKAGLRLDGKAPVFSADATLETWGKIHDRLAAREMPPKAADAPPAAERAKFLGWVSERLVRESSERARLQGRSRVRRLNRVEFENTLRDLLALPGLKIRTLLPEDGRSHGFDRLAAALDTSFVHVESYLAAVDKALNDALCPLPEKPPVFKFRYRPWDKTHHNGRESEGDVVNTVQGKETIGLVGLKRDPTFVGVKHAIEDDEPKATAVAFFRHEDADKLYQMRTLVPVLSGLHKIRVRGFSIGWDGKEVVPTERHGALSFGIFAKGEHYGTVDLPPNQGAERELSAWLERGGGMTHGTHDNLRFNPASCENLRDYAHGKNKDAVGPLVPAQGVAIEWLELEGPFHDQWPPASHVSLFGDLPVKVWTKETGTPRPRQQVWPRGNPGASPKDIYGERGDKRPAVHVEPRNPEQDADRLLRTFLRRAYRRPVIDGDIAPYVAQVRKRLAGGEAFQDAMLGAYRLVLTAPDFLLLREPVGRLDDHALAQRLSYFLWSSTPDEELFRLADRGELGRPDVLRAQSERLLNDPKARRFVENFLGQWLQLREINATQPDTKLYPEFMPWLVEAMLMETHATFEEFLKHDLGAAALVKSDFAMLNEPLAKIYGIEGVRGWDIRRVALPPGSPRGGFLTQGSVLKVTANGTTTSPVKRGAFVMEKILGIVPTPPPPDAGSIEPDVRGATTVRQQLEQHRKNPTCAGCHAKMDGYGFALESFDVGGEQRDRYRATGAGKETSGRRVNGRGVEYHYGPAVDCSGVMPDGRPFQDVKDMRDLLAAEPERLAKAFSSQLAVYATGAELSFADRAAVDRIVNAAKGRRYGVRSLLLELIQNDLFRNR